MSNDNWVQDRARLPGPSRGQFQETIPLIGLNHRVDRERKASRTGNNATWICFCESPRPLVGASGRWVGPTRYNVVRCLACEAVYFVVPLEKNRGRAIEVREVLEPIFRVVWNGPRYYCVLTEEALAPLV